MIEIIPAIDLIDGKCVRLMYGDFERKTIYSEDPLDAAKRFEAAGVRRLHMVDLDGAKTGTPVNLNVLERITAGTQLAVDFGGGIKNETSLKSVFESGARMANIGSIAVEEPDRFLSWIEKYGGNRFLLGADQKDGEVAVNGWQTTTEINVFDLLRSYARNGVTKAFVTDIGRDGAMSGPSIDLYQEIISAIPEIDLIASGGVSSIADIHELDRIGCYGVIIGRAIYEGNIKLEELAQYVG